ncbi:hypothetical protein J4221_01320 [Candidatus Pacearchaeota archaeon]|nr:hypothetical protein [Candidatus Pacearchaeota archaeon]
MTKKTKDNKEKSEEEIVEEIYKEEKETKHKKPYFTLVFLILMLVIFDIISFSYLGLFNLSLFNLGNGVNNSDNIQEDFDDKKCSDGTLYNNCSEDKPYYCYNGELIKKAFTCGCPEGYEVDFQDCK